MNFVLRQNLKDGKVPGNMLSHLEEFGLNHIKPAPGQGFLDQGNHLARVIFIMLSGLGHK